MSTALTEPVQDCHDENDAPSASLQLVAFKIGNEEYAVNIMHVQEIILIGQITRVPHTPLHMSGLTNLRGRVIPIIDLRLRLGLTATAPSEDSRIVVFHVMKKTMGAIVDAVTQVLRVDPSAVELAPAGLSVADRRHITGLVKLHDKLVILLDIERIVEQESPQG